MNEANKQPENNVPEGPNVSKNATRFALLAILLLIALFFFWSPESTTQITWSEFEDLVEEKKVEKVTVVNKETAEVYLKEDTTGKQEPSPFTFSSDQPEHEFHIGSPEVFEEKLRMVQEAYPEEEKVEIVYTAEENWFWIILIWVFPLLLLYMLWRGARRSMGKGGGGGPNIFSFGQAKAKLMETGSKPDITFKDVAGLTEAKGEMEETVDFLKHPEMYTKLGARIPKGVLLVGPPGTGKTLLAKAIAGEAGVPFFSLSGSEFVEMFVGVGASRVRDLFKKAKDRAPCIIFIDELDAIGRSRGKGETMGGGNDERESTLNQLLTEMDGFSPNSGVIVVAATNRGDVLDSALLRPGRFDRHMYLELPDIKGRKQIFEVHMRKLLLDDSINSEQLASQTPGFSGADIANACNEAALLAARRKKSKISHKEFSDALDRIIGGLERRTKVISDQERRVIAYHEAGHALATCQLKGLKGIVKVSIIPRGKSLGSTWNKPEELQLINQSQLKNDIKIFLAGRAAEDIMFNEVTSGALDDLEKVSKRAYSMIAYYGLSNKIGNISYYDSSGDQKFHKPYSEETARLIDEEVRKLVDSCYQDVKNILIDHKDQLEEIGELLLKKEVVFKEDLEKIIKLKAEV